MPPRFRDARVDSERRSRVRRERPLASVRDCHRDGASGGGATGRRSDGVVPNDVVLGGENADPSAPPAMLLTGPNMGGKSTLLRAPAWRSCSRRWARPCRRDRRSADPGGCVFAAWAARRQDPRRRVHLLGGVRRGVGDPSGRHDGLDRRAGRAGTGHVHVRRLRRGAREFTSTSRTTCKCRVMFATHYHGLSREFLASPLVQLRHMAAHVADEAVGGMSDKSRRTKRRTKRRNASGRGGRRADHVPLQAAKGRVPQELRHESRVARRDAPSDRSPRGGGRGGDGDVAGVGVRGAGRRDGDDVDARGGACDGARGRRSAGERPAVVVAAIRRGGSRRADEAVDGVARAAGNDRRDVRSWISGGGEERWRSLRERADAVSAFFHHKEKIQGKAGKPGARSPAMNVSALRRRERARAPVMEKTHASLLSIIWSKCHTASPLFPIRLSCATNSLTSWMDFT